MDEHPVLVTTSHRGVFFGYVNGEFTWNNLSIGTIGGAKRGWEMQIGMTLACTNGEDEGLQARYSVTSVGGKPAWVNAANTDKGYYGGNRSYLNNRSVRIRSGPRW